MSAELPRRQLLSWAGFTVSLDLDLLEHWLNRDVVSKTDAVSSLRIAVESDTVLLEADLQAKGFPAHFTARLRELRLYRRFVGCVVEGVSGPLGVPIPLSLVAHFIGQIPGSILRLEPDDRLLLVDLREILPPLLDVHVRDVRGTGRSAELLLGHGSFAIPPDANPLPEIEPPQTPPSESES